MNIGKETPAPPFYGVKIIEQIPLAAFLPYINRTALFKMQWGFKVKGESPADFLLRSKLELEPILNRLVKTSESESILQPKACYGYFAANSDGNKLQLFADSDSDDVIASLEFPRQKTPSKNSDKKLCLADYFLPLSSGKRDVVALQVVTIGQNASDYARELFSSDQYKKYLYWHGLNAEGVEGLAEYMHKRIRAELGLSKNDARSAADIIKGKYQGSRYSFGYSACPDLGQQYKIIDLLQADKIGVKIGDEEQLWPEESTSALIVHHQSARYFSIN